MNNMKAINTVSTAIACIGAVLCIIFAGTLAWWSADRDAPFVMLDYRVAPAKAGDNTVLIADVRRDLKRRCSVSFSRSFYDSKGTRFELTEGAQLMNRAALEAYNQRSPNILAFGIAIPKAASPGIGSVMTVLDYECNPVHQTYPISMILNMDVEVLP